MRKVYDLHMTTTKHLNRSGNPIRVGDLVDVLSFTADGTEGGEVIDLVSIRGRKPMVQIRQASGSRVLVLAAHVVLR